MGADYNGRAVGNFIYTVNLSDTERLKMTYQMPIMGNRAKRNGLFPVTNRFFNQTDRTVDSVTEAGGFRHADIQRFSPIL